MTSGYYLGKLVLSLIYILPTVRWRLWKAGRAFRSELVRNGLSDEVAGKLAEHYNSLNKEPLRLLRSSRVLGGRG